MTSKERPLEDNLKFKDAECDDWVNMVSLSHCIK